MCISVNKTQPMTSDILQGAVLLPGFDPDHKMIMVIKYINVSRRSKVALMNSYRTTHNHKYYIGTILAVSAMNFKYTHKQN